MIFNGPIYSAGDLGICHIPLIIQENLSKLSSHYIEAKKPFYYFLQWKLMLKYFYGIGSLKTYGMKCFTRYNP